ncbi:MAG: AMP-binding protein, partial [Gemmatimonadetes bacterium]|nr:AMP-binding protein [Gemmatimonadota bacterium]
ERRLVAYYAADGDETPTPGALRQHLRAALPEYMVPAALVALERLPLTPNGKLDRRALPAPEARPEEGDYAAPATSIEEILCGIWAEVLGVERVGVHDSFFDLGGHSLLTTRVVARVPALLGVDLPLRVLFETPTVREVARSVEALRGRGARTDAPPTGRARAAGTAPLSFAQERLWFLEQFEPGRPTYNVPAALRLAGVLDADALARALGELVPRHEVLRTTFMEGDDGPVQVVGAPGGWTPEHADLSLLAEGERKAALERRLHAEAWRPFDLERGPLFRAMLIRLAEQEHALLLCMHHIVSDGWSMGVLFRELSTLYAAFTRGEESPLAPLPLQYADYALWQRERLSGEALDAELAYWRDKLAGAPELLELPTDRPRPPAQSHRGASEPVALPPELVERLRALARREGCTLFMVLLAAWQVLLSRYSGQDDVVVGTPIAGRTHRELEGLVGFFVNTLALRTDLSGDPSFRALLARVRETTLGAYEHQELPFDRLVEALHVERTLAYDPLVQVVFQLRHAGDGGLDLPGIQARALGGGSSIPKFDLLLTLAEQADGLTGGLQYRAELFEPETVRQMAGHLRVLLEGIAADPRRPLSALPLLEEAERERVLVAWNRTAAPLPPACIHQLFERQVERTPGAVAVEFGAGRLTYAELGRRANRLAHLLRRRGVGPDARVGVCMERGPELLVALVAVLKAGGAYVPLDPAYPAERLAYMLRDSAAALLLTREALLQELPAVGGASVCLDRDAAAIAGEPEENPAPLAAPQNLAYVIYTSGSTGRPKGVMIQHASAVALIGWASRAFRPEERSRMLASTSV